MSGKGSRPGGRSAIVRAAVLNAALAEFAEHGFAGVRIEAVAARSGTNKTTIYRRWGTAAVLLADALQLADEEAPRPDTGSFRGDLLAVGHQALQAFGSDFAVAVGRALDAAIQVPELAAARARVWDARLEGCRVVVARGKARGEVRADVDPEMVFDLFVGGFHVHRTVRNRPVSRRFVYDLVDLVVAACAP